MQTISMFPIFPKPAGLQVSLPAGAKVLAVSLSIHTYYLHALCNAEVVYTEKRRIAAFKDEQDIPDGELGTYIGNCAQSGDYRRWHFFDQGVVGGVDDDQCDQWIQTAGRALRVGGAA